VTNKSEFTVQTIPLALFEDLRESMDLMQYANGVRPYILEWYNDIFLEAYNSKTDVDSKVNSKGEELKEKRKAVTSKELIDKTYKLRNKKLSTRQILQNYITPLINENYIDLVESELDKRAHIYFPVLETTIATKYIKLFRLDERNNILQQSKLKVSEPILYPDKLHITSKIEEVLRYSSDTGLFVEVKNHEGNNITTNELVDQYYGTYEDYFELSHSDRSQEEYLQNGKIASESQGNGQHDIKSSESYEEQSKNIFRSSNRNNLIYLCYHCGNFQTDSAPDYEKHIVKNHHCKPAYPSKAEIEQYGLKAQGKKWEI